MFFSREKEKKIEHLLGQDIEIKGNITALSPIRLDGTLSGGLTCSDALIIGETGVVRGDIRCGSVVISGEVEGNITVGHLAELLSSARITGDIKAPPGGVSIDAGAQLDGNISMEKRKKEAVEFEVQKEPKRS